MTSVKTYAEPLLKVWVVQLFISVQHQVLISPAEDQLIFKKCWEKSKVINHSLEMRLVISAQPSWNWSGVCNSNENPAAGACLCLQEQREKLLSPPSLEQNVAWWMLVLSHGSWSAGLTLAPFWCCPQWGFTRRVPHTFFLPVKRLISGFYGPMGSFKPVSCCWWGAISLCFRADSEVFRDFSKK